MTFYFDPTGSSLPLDVPAVAGNLSTDPHVLVFDTGLKIKFDRAISVASLLNASIVLQTAAATPAIIPGAFAPIGPQDYNTLGRVLELNFVENIQANSSYQVVISGVTDPLGNPLPPFIYSLITNPSTILTSRVPEEPLYIEDHSIRTDLFTNYNAITQTNPAFYIASTDPDSKDNIIVPISYNNGVITINFSIQPDPNFVTFNYFKFQYKVNGRGLNPWQPVPNAVISIVPNSNTIQIAVPSQSATPVISVPFTDPLFNYYNNALGNYGDAYTGAPYPTDMFPGGYGTPTLMFFLDGYKYRVKISGNIGYTDINGVFNSLGHDQYIQFLVDPQPMVLDPEEFMPYYPDATAYEIAELVAQYSKEAENILHVMITDTLAELMDRDPIVAQTIQDFVQAATLCALSKVYDITNGAISSQVSFGDLTISTNNPVRNNIGRSSAVTWCEMAAVVRNELYQLSNKSGMRAVMRGEKHHNPVPNRRVHHVEWNDWSIYSRPGT